MFILRQLLEGVSVVANQKKKKRKKKKKKE
jgi:hypothetical protein